MSGEGIHGPMDTCIARMQAAAAAGVVAKVEVKKETGTEIQKDQAPVRQQPALGQEALQKPASQWLKEWVKDNKKKYNAFRLSRSGPEARQAWRQIQQEGTAQDAQAFVANVVDGKKHMIKDWRANLDRVDAKHSWKTWKQALEFHDQETLLLMVKGRTLQSRRDPAIPTTLGVPYPKYLQVQLSDENFLRRKESGRTATWDRDVDDEEYEEEISALNREGVSNKRPRSDNMPPDPAPKPLDGAEAALKAVRATHSMCDKFIRELEGVVAASSKNPNSAGCKIEADMVEVIKKLTKNDTEILAFEKLCTSGAKVTKKNIEPSQKDPCGHPGRKEGVSYKRPRSDNMPPHPAPKQPPGLPLRRAGAYLFL